MIFLRRTFAVVGLALALTVLATAGRASAAQERLLTGVFGTASSSPADPYPLGPGEGGPSSVAVDEATGDFYVVDPDYERVEKFDSTGHFLLMFGKEVNKTEVEERISEKAKSEPVTVTAQEEDVCTAASGNTCQAGTRGTSPGAFDAGRFRGPAGNEETGAAQLSVAVDNSPGLSKGEVYLADDVDHLVTKFDSAGQVVEGWGDNGSGGAPDGQLNGSGGVGPGSFTAFEGVTVDSAGDLWVLDQQGYMFEFGQEGGFRTSWHVTGTLGTGDDSRGIAATPSGDLVTYDGEATVEYTPAGVKVGLIRVPRYHDRVYYDASNGEEYFYEGPGENTQLGVGVDAASGEVYVSSYFKGNESMPGPYIVESFAASCSHTQPEETCLPVETLYTGFVANGPDVWGLALDSGLGGDPLYAAVGSSHGGSPAEVDVYSVVTVPDAVTGVVSGASGTEAKLSGTVDPDGVELVAGSQGCRFEWGETTGYGHEVGCEQSAGMIGKGTAPVAVSAKLAGLQAGHTYHYRLVAGNANDVNGLIDEPRVGVDSVFGPPVIRATSVTEVTSDSAILQAEIDPQNIDTRYRFEYGVQPGVYEDATPEVDLGAGGETQTVVFHLQGLSTHTLYHYRVVAANPLGEPVGGEEMFVTQGNGSSAMLDGRAWELVSPPEKHGGFIYPIYSQGVVQAAASGDAITYVSSVPIGEGAEGAGNSSQILSARGSSGWASRDITPPHATPVGLSLYGEEYRFFSEDLSAGVVQPKGRFESALSSEATEQTAFLHTDFSSSDPFVFCTQACYRPLVTGAEGVADVREGVQFGKEGLCEADTLCGPQFLDGTPDAQHLVLGSEVGLTETAGDKGGLYEYTVGAPPSEQLRLVSALPDGKPAEYASTGPMVGAGVGGDNLVPGADDARNAVSDDGSRVVWSEIASGSGKHLYLRYNATSEQSMVEHGECVEPGKACTIQLDQVQGGSGKGNPKPEFQDASVDDDRIFFTDEQALVPGAGATSDALDLYECHIVEAQNGGLRCELSDLTPETGGESANVQGRVLGVSADGSAVYFVANGDLTGQEENEHGERAVRGDCSDLNLLGTEAMCNLYQEHDGALRLVAVLSNWDEPDYAEGNAESLPTARVTADGQWLAFMSQRSLTGYDNRDAINGKPDEEVYLYDAGGAGTLVCASCNPTGARPHGKEYKQLSIDYGGLVGGDRAWAGTQWIAANIPGWTPYTQTSDHALYQSRYLSDSGRLFFNSSDALVPQDTNSQEDVYEYEPAGVGSCTAESQTYSPSSGGCVDLISSGTSPDESAFLDASENGDDVFFLTSAKLSPQDKDTSVDIYDAHVCTSEAPCPVPEEPGAPPCQGDACQQPVAPPAELVPGSLTFNGPGNQLVTPAPGSTKTETKTETKTQTKTQKLASALKVCRRDRSKAKRMSCERQAKRKYGAGKTSARRGSSAGRGR